MIGIKDFAMEAKKLKGVAEEPAEETKPIAKKPSVEWSVEIVTYPDIIIRKTRATKIEFLAIMPSVEGYYIKTIHKDGKKDCVLLDADKYSKFTAGMPDICLPDDYWISKLVSGKAFYTNLEKVINDPAYCDMIRHRAFPKKYDLMWFSNQNRMNGWKRIYNSSPDIWREFGGNERFIKLFTPDEQFIAVLMELFGLDNTRDFVRSLIDSIIDNRDVRYGYYGTLYGVSSNLTGMELKGTEYKRFKEYILQDAIQMGYALSMGNFFQTWKDTINMQRQVFGKVVERYPKDLLLMHNQLSYRCVLLREKIEEEGFQNQVIRCIDHEDEVDDFIFIAPRTRRDFNEEAAQQSNCVASYVRRFSEGTCMIFFMRRKSELEKSYITIEVTNNKVVQAKKRFNANPSTNDWDIIRRWELKQFQKR